MICLLSGDWWMTARSHARGVTTSLLVGLETRCLDDRPPALVVGALDLSEGLAGRPRYLEAEGLDPGPDLGSVQSVEDRRAQALGNGRGRACGSPHREPIRCLDVVPALPQGRDVRQDARTR